MMIILITLQILRFNIQITKTSILYQEVIKYQIFIQSKNILQFSKLNFKNKNF